jgi:hypothetical protein
MILSIVGLLLLALGLFSGAILVAVPLGLTEATPGIVLWGLFPTFSIGGYLLFLTATPSARIHALARSASVFLLLLALVAAGGLVLDAAGMRPTSGSTFSLWYVLIVAGCAGIAGAAAHGRPTADT